MEYKIFSLLLGCTIISFAVFMASGIIGWNRTADVAARVFATFGILALLYVGFIIAFGLFITG